jgi:hypothetical protein
VRFPPTHPAYATDDVTDDAITARQFQHQPCSHRAADCIDAWAITHRTDVRMQQAQRSAAGTTTASVRRSCSENHAISTHLGNAFFGIEG